MSQSRIKSDHQSSRSIPRWVKVFGIITLVVILLFIILMLTRGHGPNLHTLLVEQGMQRL